MVTSAAVPVVASSVLARAAAIRRVLKAYLPALRPAPTRYALCRSPATALKVSPVDDVAA